MTDSFLQSACKNCPRKTYLSELLKLAHRNIVAKNRNHSAGPQNFSMRSFEFFHVREKWLRAKLQLQNQLPTRVDQTAAVCWSGGGQQGCNFLRLLLTS